MTKPDTATALAVDSAAVENPNQAVVVLDEPIARTGETIGSVTLRKPMSGELRGCSLVDLMNLEVNALRKVLPRITTPTLTDVEVGRMDPADLVQCGMAVASFLLQKSARKEVSLSA